MAGPNPISSKRLPASPPRNFKPAGVIEWVQHSPSAPGFVKPTARRRGRRAAGERYERKVQKELDIDFGAHYVRSPWFKFREVGASRTRWCQPDGLLFQPAYSTITIVEIKLQHTSDAWWQVRELYYPVVVSAFPSSLWEYNFCEIVRWYDPNVSFPEPVRLAPHLLSLGSQQFGVHILSV